MRPAINSDTREIGIGPLGFDVDMARAHAWREDEIENAWAELEAVHQKHSRAVARRQGMTRQCPNCENWCVPGDGPCAKCIREAM